MSESTPTKKIRGVFQRPPGSGIWWISYKQGSVRKREKVGRKSDAIALYQKRRTELLSGRKLPENLKRSPLTFAQIAAPITEYSRTHHTDTRNVTQRLRRIVESLGDRSADQMKPAEIDEWLSQNTKTAATANRYKSTFSLVFREAIRNGKLVSNPARLVRARKENNGRIRYLLLEEETRLQAFIEEKFPEHLPEIIISLRTGMRLSEQYSLCWDQVDFTRREINLRKTKNGLPRTIPMTNLVFSSFVDLKRRAGHHEPESRVFALQNPREWFSTALGGAQVLAYRWHDNRHTFCSRLAEKGAGIKTIQQLAGHKTISMSARYMHMGDDSLRAAVAKLD